MMCLYLYRSTPIDFGWEFLRPYSEVVGQYLSEPTDPEFAAVAHMDVRACLLRGMLNHCLLHIIDEFSGFAAEPKVGCVPGEGEFHHFLAWKDMNNGTTYIACEKPIVTLQGLDDVEEMKVPWDVDCFERYLGKMLTPTSKGFFFRL